jgi:NAD(P)-dependent dehydrogenase (short-subunit alcohol dehydrogenase family)
MTLEGRVAVVTGAAGGLGAAVADRLAANGAGVERIDLEGDGRRLDVRDAAAVAAAFDEIGRVDILVNCAGRTQRTPTLDVGEAEWNAILDTNLTGTLRACQAFGRAMIERGYGRIINIASLGSFVALLEVAAYAASKAGVASLTRQLAIEWGAKGVCVNAIMPGVFRTALNGGLLDGTARGQEFLLRTPMRRFGRLDELAGAAVFLASESASFVNGEVLVVDGGFLASGVNQ